MLVGDFPTVFPTIMKQNGNLRKRHYTHIYICAVNITYVYTCTYILDVSKRGVLDRRMTILNFSAYSANFSGHYFWLIMIMFFGEYRHIPHIQNTIVHFFCRL